MLEPDVRLTSGLYGRKVLLHNRLHGYGVGCMAGLGHTVSDADVWSLRMFVIGV
jgi:hypothetical protein